MSFKTHKRQKPFEILLPYMYTVLWFTPQMILKSRHAAVIITMTSYEQVKINRLHYFLNICVTHYSQLTLSWYYSSDEIKLVQVKNQMVTSKSIWPSEGMNYYMRVLYAVMICITPSFCCFNYSLRWGVLSAMYMRILSWLVCSKTCVLSVNYAFRYLFFMCYQTK